jgi:hypothetical protein
VTATEKGGTVIEDIRNLRTAHLRVRETLREGERRWVVGHLLSRGGVENVGCEGEARPQLVVEYDADRLNGASLLDILHACGLHAAPAPLETAASATLAAATGTGRPPRTACP